MTTHQERLAVSRRGFLAQAGATAVMLTVTGTAVLSPLEGWGMEVTSLTPETVRTLIKLARDIYPHDRIADRFYAIAVKTHDGEAAKDPAFRSLLEDGTRALDAAAGKKHGVPYVAVGWETDRLALLEPIETGPFFQKVRGGLVVGLYNQKAVWPLFGYEGESASRGGYIDRGFNDIEWI